MINQRYSDSVARGFMSKVYGWMCAGLGVTAAIAYYLSPEMNPMMLKALTSNFMVVIGLVLVQLGVLFYMMWNYAKLSYASMAIMFMVFCALQGLTLAPVMHIYNMSSILYVFFIAAGMFVIMALYGWITNADLSSMRNVLLMGLVGLIIANLMNVFMRSQTFDLVISSIGVGIFALLTAYDVQNLKKYSQYGVTSPEDSGKFAILGAISLYMNIINLFLYLLRLFGDRRK